MTRMHPKRGRTVTPACPTMTAQLHQRGQQSAIQDTRDNTEAGNIRYGGRDKTGTGWGYNYRNGCRVDGVDGAEGKEKLGTQSHRERGVDKEHRKEKGGICSIRASMGIEGIENGGREEADAVRDNNYKSNDCMDEEGGRRKGRRWGEKLEIRPHRTRGNNWGIDEEHGKEEGDRECIATGLPRQGRRECEKRDELRETEILKKQKGGEGVHLTQSCTKRE